MAELTELLIDTRYGEEPMEGVVIRREWAGSTLERAKLVRPHFAQAIEDHWSRGPLRRNTLATGQ